MTKGLFITCLSGRMPPGPDIPYFRPAAELEGGYYCSQCTEGTPRSWLIYDENEVM